MEADRRRAVCGGREAGKMGESEAIAARYWCHMCSQLVSPIVEMELKCPHCNSGFVEEMDARGDMDDQALSLWAPIWLGMLGGGSLRRRRGHREEERENSDPDGDREVETIRRRRRRTSAILHLLHVLREGNRRESDGADAERESGRRRESLILINPFTDPIILQGSTDANQLQSHSSSTTGVSPGDYFLGPGLDLLLQRLAESETSRYGTPPALKEAVDAMPTVKIEKNTSCSICLEDFEVGDEGREMPCKHTFHSGCILPWLDLHSSCPVCRFQMPADESKVVPSAGGSGSREGVGGGESLPWPSHRLFSLAGSQSSSSSSVSSPPSSSSSSTSGSNSQPNEN
ncbi:hypothetical protein C4D60_Mb06t09490 [Musa balbisiana]|uniref:RING-type E3 ubiquitin transferase n=1 Tax=Musa balbisiana TaxID=52838 RepID=A0A4S8ILT3_MUSBA|nr:hypothetical protein C4D60_Mb06t09490 [Musa balbisiana]